MSLIASKKRPLKREGKVWDVKSLVVGKVLANWMQFLRDSVNKHELFAFLTDKAVEYPWSERNAIYVTEGTSILLLDD